MSDLKMEQASIRFFVNPPENNKDAIYSEAVRRAYSDMSRHTLHYKSEKYQGQSKEAIQARSTLKSKISERLAWYETKVFAVRSQKEYDKLHQSMCKDVSDIFTSPDDNGIIPIDATPKEANSTKRKSTFSMGQSQKIVNMVWKYVYMFYQYYNAENYTNYANELEQFKGIIGYLHAPIDGYVVSAVTNRTSAYYLNCEAPEFPWSQQSYKEYSDFQNRIREGLEKSNQHPFSWELENYPFKRRLLP